MAEKRIRRGDVYYICRYPTCGSEQQAARPAVVVSNDFCNGSSAVIEVVYLTSQVKKPLPTHVAITCTGRASVALCEQVTSVAVERLGDCKCHVSQEEMLLIDHALAVSLGIQTEKPDADAGERKYPDQDRLMALVCLKYLQRVLGQEQEKDNPDL